MSSVEDEVHTLSIEVWAESGKKTMKQFDGVPRKHLRKLIASAKKMARLNGSWTVVLVGGDVVSITAPIEHREEVMKYFIDPQIER